MIDILVLTLRICALMLVLFAAYEDVRGLRIRNAVALAVAALFVPVASTLPMHVLSVHLIGAAIVFAVGFMLFLGGLFGGGDAKLLAAVALWLNPHVLPAFMLIMTVAGGVLALLALGFKRVTVLEKLTPALAAKVGDKSWFGALSRQETVVPYGVAIAVAVLCTFFKL